MRSRLPDKDDDARDEIINASRSFLKGIMASRGRRTDVESTAFWAAAVALIPSDVLKNRKGRAIMRLLDIDYRVVKKASEMRAGLEDGSKIWKHVTTAKHCDTASWQHVVQWLHSDEASCEDNAHKEMVRIDIGVEKGVHEYVFHRARILLDTKGALLVKFKSSSTYALMCQEFMDKKAAVRRRQALDLATASLRDRDEVHNKPSFRRFRTPGSNICTTLRSKLRMMLSKVILILVFCIKHSGALHEKRTLRGRSRSSPRRSKRQRASEGRSACSAGGLPSLPGTRPMTRSRKPWGIPRTIPYSKYR